MSHFGSSAWPAGFGTVAQLSSTVPASQLGAVGASPVTGSTEGSDLLTYVVPTGGSGLYLIAASIHVDVVSNAGTSQTVEVNVAYNDGDAVTATALGEVGSGQGTGVTAAPADTTSGGDARIQQMGIVRLEAGTTVTVASIAVNGGTVATTGSLEYDFAIVRLSS